MWCMSVAGAINVYEPDCASRGCMTAVSISLPP